MLKRRTFIKGACCAVFSSQLRAQSASARHYVGSLQLEAMPDGRMMRLLQPYGFISSSGQQWNVPARAVVDGASIPRVLWPIVGGPWEGSYRNASVIHDWFCAVRTMPWKATHLMFYEAMLTSGVDATRARMMFLAVRYCGPSWDDLTLANSRLLTHNGQVRLDPPGIATSSGGFASPEESENARAALLSRFNELVAEAEQGNLTPDEIGAIVDAAGRQEEVAAMLAE